MKPSFEEKLNDKVGEFLYELTVSSRFSATELKAQAELAKRIAAWSRAETIKEILLFFQFKGFMSAFDLIRKNFVS